MTDNELMIVLLVVWSAILICCVDQVVFLLITWRKGNKQ